MEMRLKIGASGRSASRSGVAEERWSMNPGAPAAKAHTALRQGVGTMEREASDTYR